MLTQRARRDLRFLVNVSNRGLPLQERISPVEYLKDFVDAGLLERASQIRKGEHSG